MNCPTCGEPIHYVADYAAPGYGQSWACPRGHRWAKIGSTLHDPATGAHILQPEDVR